MYTLSPDILQISLRSELQLAVGTCKSYLMPGHPRQNLEQNLFANKVASHYRTQSTFEVHDPSARPPHDHAVPGRWSPTAKMRRFFVLGNCRPRILTSKHQALRTEVQQTTNHPTLKCVGIAVRRSYGKTGFAWVCGIWKENKGKMTSVIPKFWRWQKLRQVTVGTLNIHVCQQIKSYGNQ